MSSANLQASRPAEQQAAQVAYGRRQLVLPTWQPDSDVSHCFVCNSPFTLFFRKHHCRRCGRVVCRSCSPHRITMPRQFIVQPPSSMTSSDEEDQVGFSSPDLGLTGNEEVRVCNPCVPDPNPHPPNSPNVPAFHARVYSSDSASHFFAANTTSASLDRPMGFVSGREQLRSRPPRPIGHRTSYSVTDLPSPLRREVDGGVSRPPFPGYAARMRTEYGHQRIAPIGDDPQPGAYRGSMIPTDLSMILPNDIASHGPLARSVRRVRASVAEEDECPVCGDELPPRHSDDGESSRKAHIESCLESHMYSSSAPPDSILRPISEPTHSRTDLEAQSALRLVQDNRSPDAGRSQQRRLTRGQMLVYTATEKDCIGTDTTTQECVICLEDFEVRQEMARLECLCKFHRKCIRDWWNTKGVGSCPTHQLHA